MPTPPRPGSAPAAGARPPRRLLAAARWSCRSPSTRGWLPGGEANPVLDVLVLLSLVGGPALPRGERDRAAPAAVVHATGHPAARDPYFLYAASNLGSMLALLGYPSSSSRACSQDAGWLTQTGCGRLGYLDAGRSHGACARRSSAERRAAVPDPGDAPARRPSDAAPAEARRRGRRLHWVAARLRAVEPAARRHHLHHHRPRRHPAALGAAARDLPADASSSRSAAGRGAPARGGGARAAPRPARVVPHGLGPARAHLGDACSGTLVCSSSSALACHGELALGPALAAAPHRVLPLHLGGRRARRALQRPGRAARLQLADRVSAAHGAGAVCSWRAPSSPGRRRAPRRAARCSRSAAAVLLALVLYSEWPHPARRPRRSSPACSTSARAASRRGSTRRAAR